MNGEVQQADDANHQTFAPISLDSTISTFVTRYFGDGERTDYLLLVVDYFIFIQNEFLKKFERIRHAKVCVFVDVWAYSHHVVRSTC